MFFEPYSISSRALAASDTCSGIEVCEEDSSWYNGFASKAEVASARDQFAARVRSGSAELVLSAGSVRLRVPRDKGPVAGSLPRLVERSLSGRAAEAILNHEEDSLADDEWWEPPVDIPSVVPSSGGGRRSVIKKWSAKSRARLVRRIAELDYSPMFGGGRRPVMVTLTLPADFRAYTPDGKVFKAQIHKLVARWERRWAESVMGVWKLEFQRRGAPHLHIFTVIPFGRSPRDRRQFKAWLSRAWAECVAHPDPKEFEKHVFAGVDISYSSAEKGNTARRAAIYFAKYGAFADKGYQNFVPEGWENVGRFWGVWGLKPVRESASVPSREAVKISRALRRLGRRRVSYRRANGRRTHKRGSAFGASRSYGNVTPSFALGGTLLTDDPVRLSECLARLCTIEKAVPPQPSVNAFIQLVRDGVTPFWLTASSASRICEVAETSSHEAFELFLCSWVKAYQKSSRVSYL